MLCPMFIYVKKKKCKYQWGSMHIRRHKTLNHFITSYTETAQKIPRIGRKLKEPEGTKPDSMGKGKK